MAVKLRLKRYGSHKRPCYRIVAVDSRKKRDGRVIEELGYYHPLRAPFRFSLDVKRYTEWLKKGAIPTETVERLVEKHRESGEITTKITDGNEEEVLQDEGSG